MLWRNKFNDFPNLPMHTPMRANVPNEIVRCKNSLSNRSHLYSWKRVNLKINLNFLRAKGRVLEPVQKEAIILSSELWTDQKGLPCTLWGFQIFNRVKEFTIVSIIICIHTYIHNIHTYITIKVVSLSRFVFTWSKITTKTFGVRAHTQYTFGTLKKILKISFCVEFT